MASSATITSRPVLSAMSLSKPFIRQPPPVRITPRSLMSAASSGGVLSRTYLMASTILEMDSSKHSIRLFAEISMVLGNPSTRFLPLTFIVISSSNAYTVPIRIFISSAILSPISMLCFFRMYLMIASSNLSPAILIERLVTMPPRDMTAISVVPPPISTTILP